MNPLSESPEFTGQTEYDFNVSRGVVPESQSSDLKNWNQKVGC